MHPFTSLTLWGWLAVTAFLLPLDALIGLTLIAFAGLAGWPASRPRWRLVAMLAVPMGCSLWLVHGGVVSVWLGGTPAEPDTQRRMVLLWLRLVFMVTTAQIWLTMVPVPRFIRALFGSRLSAGLAMVLAGPLLLTVQLRRQLAAVREAQIARGVPLDGTFMERCRSMPAVLLPLVNSALLDMTTRATALDLKAFRSVARRTTLWTPADSPVQGMLRWAMTGLMAAEILFFVSGCWA